MPKAVMIRVIGFVIGASIGLAVLQLDRVFGTTPSTIVVYYAQAPMPDEPLFLLLRQNHGKRTVEGFPMETIEYVDVAGIQVSLETVVCGTSSAADRVLTRELRESRFTNPLRLNDGPWGTGASARVALETRPDGLGRRAIIITQIGATLRITRAATVDEAHMLEWYHRARLSPPN